MLYNSALNTVCEHDAAIIQNNNAQWVAHEFPEELLITDES